jgi:V/A-type H+-transporting ATPase subunit A
VIGKEKMAAAQMMLREGNEIKQMMAVVGEEGTSVDDFTTMLKAEFFDNVYLQQNAFDETDGATPADRQRMVFDTILQVLEMDFEFEDQDQARKIMVDGTDLFRTWNYAPLDSDEFKKIQGEVEQFIAKKGRVA